MARLPYPPQEDTDVLAIPQIKSAVNRMMALSGPLALPSDTPPLAAWASIVDTIAYCAATIPLRNFGTTAGLRGAWIRNLAVLAEQEAARQLATIELPPSLENVPFTAEDKQRLRRVAYLVFWLSQRCLGSDEPLSPAELRMQDEADGTMACLCAHYSFPKEWEQPKRAAVSAIIDHQPDVLTSLMTYTCR